MASKSHKPVFLQIRLTFTPLTASSKKIDRKMQLKELLENAYDKDLEKIKKRCENEHLLIDVNFYVIESDKKGRSNPDLDNLLKILFDVLSENMVNGQKALSGIGIIKNDSQIYEIKCSKIPLDEDNLDKEGLTLQISVIQ